MCSSCLDLTSADNGQGRYLPLFASAVSDGNIALKKQGKTEINLKSVMIGNGITDLCE
jgi:cathepsin A (carboxypeptidase C)